MNLEINNSERLFLLKAVKDADRKYIRKGIVTVRRLEFFIDLSRKLVK